tara:strand:- start:508 stop:969 length:462 start_codon:yes stop_codon:yes gene_type:complete
MIEVRRSIIQDCFQLAPRLRKEDITELHALSSRPPLQSLIAGHLYSTPCYTGFDKNGLVLGMGGCAPLDKEANTASIWFLGAEELFDHKTSFLRLSRKFLEISSEPYDLVCNVVHAENVTHVRWLEWLGFSFLQKLPDFGRNNELFYEFARMC